MNVKPLSSRVWPEGGARAEVQPEALGENNRSHKEILYNSYLTSFEIKRFSTDSFVTFPFDSLNFSTPPPPLQKPGHFLSRSALILKSDS